MTGQKSTNLADIEVPSHLGRAIADLKKGWARQYPSRKGSGAEGYPDPLLLIHLGEILNRVQVNQRTLFLRHIRQLRGLYEA